MLQFEPQAWLSLGEALLIGLLVGIERGGDRVERHAGLRDFILIGLAGGVCGLLAAPLITIGALLAITVYLAVFRIQTPGRTGITTEMAAVTTFLLCVLTTTQSLPWGSPLAIAAAVILTLFLDMQKQLQRFFVEVITETEFNDTLRFLAVIFVILPILPNASYGPYGFLNPHQVWVFIILVCTISYAGYFMEKFFGKSRGLALTAVLGGLASTTASTVAFARQSSDEPEHTVAYARATVLANSIQAPRLFALLFFVSPALAWASAPAMAAIFVAGLVVAAIPRREAATSPSGGLTLRNPFRFVPALQFGVVFAIAGLLARGASAEFGSAGVMAAAAIGGSIDADATVLTVSELTRDSGIATNFGTIAVLIAFASNAALKAIIAFTAGGRKFGLPVLFGFVVMIAAGAIAAAFA